MISFNDPRSGESVAVRELNTAERNPWSYPTVAAIGPKGQIVIRHAVPNTMIEIGDVPIKCMDGQLVLSPRYTRAGWVMYEDLCAGRVQGVAADPDAWKRWQSLVSYNAAGRRLPAQLSDDDKLFHPEVARRRLAGGVAKTPTVDEFKSDFPGYVFDDEAGDAPAPKPSRKAAG